MHCNTKCSGAKLLKINGKKYKLRWLNSLRLQCKGGTIQRMKSQLAKLRRKLPKNDRVRILSLQNNCCFWCRAKFGQIFDFRGKPTEIKIHWDHVIPLAYSHSNTVTNFVAACQFCNRWKYSKVFDSIKEVRSYVERKWRQEVRRMWKRVYTKEEMAKILHKRMQMDKLEQKSSKSRY